MNKIINQKGAGLIEVLVSLLILSVCVLGFTALQLRAFEATHEGVYRVQAINLARDVSERIRSNRNGLAKYKEEIKAADKQQDFTKNCYTDLCSRNELADFDVSQVRKTADSLGMTFNLLPCQGQDAKPAASRRECVYVAWNDTSATDGSDTTACTKGTSYRKDSQCIILEAY